MVECDHCRNMVDGVIDVTMRRENMHICRECILGLYRKVV